MKLTSSSFQNNGKISPEFAFCAPDPKTHATLSENRNPELAIRGHVLAQASLTGVYSVNPGVNV